MNDLTVQEQANVRVAIMFLRAKCGGWAPLAKVLRFSLDTLAHVAHGDKAVTPRMVFRVARSAGVAIDDLLAGKFPPAGKCAYCGHMKTPDDIDRA